LRIDLKKKYRNNNITFKTLDEISKNTVIINCITGIKAGIIKKKLSQIGFKNYSWIEFKNALYIDKINYWYLGNFNNYFFKNMSNFLNIYKILKDFKSKKQFLKILKYKVIGNQSVFNNGFESSNQYFPEFIKFNNDSILIDVGAFDGDTISSFIKLNYDYKEIFAFEPNKSNFFLLKENHLINKKIKLQNLALGSVSKSMKFKPLNDASRVDESGKANVNVKKLDELRLKPTYIKVDIEGGEADFISGAKDTIKKFKPILAICVYHKKEDFFDIPKMILRINPNYKVYFRHYSMGFTESVMYFI
jgi:FkbM family methyltransferase